MRGRAVFYPMGWDDNGLPTERRVQNYFGVRCDPSLPYDPSFVPPDKPPKHAAPGLAPELHRAVRAAHGGRREGVRGPLAELGLSVDWALTYSTVGRDAQRVSQQAFLRLLRRGEAYQLEAPTLWDIDFRTAVAQAELEDREHAGRLSPDTVRESGRQRRRSRSTRRGRS